jgi:hypothetical protein
LSHALAIDAARARMPSDATRCSAAARTGSANPTTSDNPTMTGTRKAGTTSVAASAISQAVAIMA